MLQFYGEPCRAAPIRPIQRLSDGAGAGSKP
jgi:hypothetical protein